MKKNLRIVSAAAAALLAVAPVATTVVPAASSVVSAATNTSVIDAGHNGLFVNKITLAKNADLGANSISQFIQGELGNSVVTAEGVTVAKDGKSATFNIKGTPNSDVPAALVQAGYNKKFNKDGLATAGTGKDEKPAIFTVNSEAAKPADTSSENITNNKIDSSIFDADANTSVNIVATASTGLNGQNSNWKSTINGNIVYTDAQGKNFTALLHGDQNTTVYEAKDFGASAPKPGAQPVSSLAAGVAYVASFNKVTINLGNSKAGEKVRFVLPESAAFAKHDGAGVNVKTVTVDANGIADLGTVNAEFYAYDPTDLQEVHFYSQKTGNIVTSGSINMHAVNGKLNIYSLWHAMNTEYVASQLDNGKSLLAKPLIPQNDLRDQLKKQNVTVDDNGYFTAPASFSLNLNVKSLVNSATATLPVTVTVDNVTPAASQETTKTVTIMHIAAIYDKNGVATHDPALRAYDTYSVVAEPVTINGAKFYKLAGKDQYIKVGNVDGTKRTLKHNSYVYKSTGKRRGKTVLKKGSSVTTYGKSFMIAGHQMYRIGENQYVKKANF